MVKAVYVQILEEQRDVRRILKWLFQELLNLSISKFHSNPHLHPLSSEKFFDALLQLVVHRVVLEQNSLYAYSHRFWPARRINLAGESHSFWPPCRI